VLKSQYYHDLIILTLGRIVNLNMFREIRTWISLRTMYNYYSNYSQ